MTQTREAAADACEAFVPERNHYYAGKILSARDFHAEQQYFNHKRWMLNRHLFGWGVVCGLDVQWDGKAGRLVVDPGLALDCCGREIMVPVRERVRIDERYRQRRPGFIQELVVCLEYRECHTEPVRDPLDPRCHGTDRTRYNRVRDSYEITVRPREEVCTNTPQRPCYLDYIKGGPGPGGRDLARGEVREEAREEVRDERGDESPAADTAEKLRPLSCRTPGMHEYLCGEIRERCPRCRGCECVVLAALEVTYPRTEPAVRQGDRSSPDPAASSYPPPETPDPCRELDPPQVSLDACAARRFVYGNPLLYDLIECFHGDLPHIVRLGWNASGPGRRMEWAEFHRLVAVQGLAVTFDRPMRADTLNGHTFLVSVRVADRGTGYWITKYVPHRAIEYRPNTPYEGCHTAVFLADSDWVRDEVEKGHSEISGGTEVEVTLRGSLIMDDRGKALDGDYIGYRLPTGNGTQGGDFVDWFAVDERPASYEPAVVRAAAEGDVIEDF